uniref:Uncharacterized protein n=1 Tax=Leersia perrieri TaxID=77586 RepID=A0A0D9XLD4_9ORYZ
MEEGAGDAEEDLVLSLLSFYAAWTRGAPNSQGESEHSEEQQWQGGGRGGGEAGGEFIGSVATEMTGLPLRWLAHRPGLGSLALLRLGSARPNLSRLGSAAEVGGGVIESIHFAVILC